MSKGLRWYTLGAVCAAAFIAGAMAGSCAHDSSAASPVTAGPQDTPWEPETVCFAIAERAHISPVEWAATVGELGATPAVVRIVPNEWTEDDVELLARLLWSSPIRHENVKRQLVWLVLNRVDDERSMFPATIRENVTTREFTFYDRRAYLSETNVRIAREELQRWTRVLSGAEERPVPIGYVYLRFGGDNNRMIYLMKEPGGDAL